MRKLKGVVGLWAGMVDALRLIRRLRPSVVMGVGAYVSGTVLLTAALKNVPTLILEPNAEPGLANRWLAPFVDEAACAWEVTTKAFGSKAVVTGNPVRQSILDVPEIAKPGTTMRVLVFGGSQGSRVLNRTVTEALPRLAPLHERIEILHQTGADDFARVEGAYAAHPFRARVTPFIERMDEAYASSDLVIARAGATTCAELAAAGRPAILIPLSLAGGHQETNAAMLAEAGAATFILERELSPERFAQAIEDLLDAPEQRGRMAAKARSLARPAAAAAVADRLVALARSRGEGAA